MIYLLLSFCYTCQKHLKEGKIPKFAMHNGLTFPEIPDVLQKLTPLEERIVSPRHIFLKIVRRGQVLGFQHGLVGNVVNVPFDVNTMVSALPRYASATHVIPLVLKRKMCYKHGRQERIRPAIVKEAAKYLVQTELFKELKITFDDNWTYDDEVDTSDNDTSNNECTCEPGEIGDEPVNPGNA